MVNYFWQEWENSVVKLWKVVLQPFTAWFDSRQDLRWYRKIQKHHHIPYSNYGVKWSGIAETHLLFSNQMMQFCLHLTVSSLNEVLPDWRFNKISCSISVHCIATILTLYKLMFLWPYMWNVQSRSLSVWKTKQRSWRSRQMNEGYELLRFFRGVLEKNQNFNIVLPLSPWSGTQLSRQKKQQRRERLPGSCVFAW